MVSSATPVRRLLGSCTNSAASMEDILFCDIVYNVQLLFQVLEEFALMYGT